MDEQPEDPLANYSSLRDPNLQGYFQSPALQQHLQKIGMIAKDGRILSEKEFRRLWVQRQQRQMARRMLAHTLSLQSRDFDLGRQLELQRQLDAVRKVTNYREARGRLTVDDSELIRMPPIDLERSFTRSQSTSGFRQLRNQRLMRATSSVQLNSSGSEQEARHVSARRRSLSSNLDRPPAALSPNDDPLLRSAPLQLYSGMTEAQILDNKEPEEALDMFRAWLDESMRPSAVPEEAELEFLTAVRKTSSKLTQLLRRRVAAMGFISQFWSTFKGFPFLKNQQLKRYLEGVYRYAYLHKLDPNSLDAYRSHLSSELQRLKRLRENFFNTNISEDHWDINALPPSLSVLGYRSNIDRPSTLSPLRRAQSSWTHTNWEHSPYKSASLPASRLARTRSLSPMKATSPQAPRVPNIERIYGMSAGVQRRRPGCECFVQYLGPMALHSTIDRGPEEPPKTETEPTDGEQTKMEVDSPKDGEQTKVEPGSNTDTPEPMDTDAVPSPSPAGGDDKSQTMNKITVLQQHTGGNQIVIFQEELKPGSKFSFPSHRFVGYPFTLVFQENGEVVAKMSVCCESRYKPRARVGGKTGIFKWLGVKNAIPCYKCQALRQLEAPYTNYGRKAQQALKERAQRLAEARKSAPPLVARSPTKSAPSSPTKKAIFVESRVKTMKPPVPRFPHPQSAKQAPADGLPPRPPRKPPVPRVGRQAVPGSDEVVVPSVLPPTGDVASIVSASLAMGGARSMEVHHTTLIDKDVTTTVIVSEPNADGELEVKSVTQTVEPTEHTETHEESVINTESAPQPTAEIAEGAAEAMASGGDEPPAAEANEAAAPKADDFFDEQHRSITPIIEQQEQVAIEQQQEQTPAAADESNSEEDESSSSSSSSGSSSDSESESESEHDEQEQKDAADDSSVANRLKSAGMALLAGEGQEAEPIAVDGGEAVPKEEVEKLIERECQKAEGIEVEKAAESTAENELEAERKAAMADVAIEEQGEVKIDEPESAEQKADSETHVDAAEEAKVAASRESTAKSTRSKRSGVGSPDKAGTAESSRRSSTSSAASSASEHPSKAASESRASSAKSDASSKSSTSSKSSESAKSSASAKSAASSKSDESSQHSSATATPKGSKHSSRASSAKSEKSEGSSPSRTPTPKGDEANEQSAVPLKEGAERTPSAKSKSSDGIRIDGDSRRSSARSKAPTAEAEVEAATAERRASSAHSKAASTEGEGEASRRESTKSASSRPQSKAESTHSKASEHSSRHEGTESKSSSRRESTQSRGGTAAPEGSDEPELGKAASSRHSSAASSRSAAASEAPEDEVFAGSKPSSRRGSAESKTETRSKRSVDSAPPSSSRHSSHRASLSSNKEGAHEEKLETVAEEDETSKQSRRPSASSRADTQSRHSVQLAEGTAASEQLTEQVVKPVEAVAAEGSPALSKPSTRPPTAGGEEQAVIEQQSIKRPDSVSSKKSKTETRPPTAEVTENGHVTRPPTSASQKSSKAGTFTRPPTAADVPVPEVKQEQASRTPTPASKAATGTRPPTAEVTQNGQTEHVTRPPTSASQNSSKAATLTRPPSADATIPESGAVEHAGRPPTSASKAATGTRPPTAEVTESGPAENTSRPLTPVSERVNMVYRPPVIPTADAAANALAEQATRPPTSASQKSKAATSTRPPTAASENVSTEHVSRPPTSASQKSKGAVSIQSATADVAESGAAEHESRPPTSASHKSKAQSEAVENGSPDHVSTRPPSSTSQKLPTVVYASRPPSGATDARPPTSTSHKSKATAGELTSTRPQSAVQVGPPNEHISRPPTASSQPVESKHTTRPPTVEPPLEHISRPPTSASKKSEPQVQSAVNIDGPITNGEVKESPLEPASGRSSAARSRRESLQKQSPVQNDSPSHRASVASKEPSLDQGRTSSAASKRSKRSIDGAVEILPPAVHMPPVDEAPDEAVKPANESEHFLLANGTDFEIHVDGATPQPSSQKVSTASIDGEALEHHSLQQESAPESAPSPAPASRPSSRTSKASKEATPHSAGIPEEQAEIAVPHVEDVGGGVLEQPGTSAAAEEHVEQTPSAQSPEPATPGSSEKLEAETEKNEAARPASANLVELSPSLAAVTMHDDVSYSNRQLGVDEMVGIGERLAQRSDIRSVTFRSCELTDEAVEVLADALEESSAPIKTISLNSNNLTAKAVPSLMRLTRNKPVNILQLTENELGDEGAKALLDGLNEQKDSEKFVLTRLDLGENNIKDEGTRALGNFLAHNKSLQKLSISGNSDIGTEGWSALANGLKENDQLHVLSFDYCKMGDDNCELLCEVLKNAPQIKSIDFEGNELTEKSVVALTELARHCPNLSNICILAGNNITTNSASRIRQIIAGKQPGAAEQKDTLTL